MVLVNKECSKKGLKLTKDDFLGGNEYGNAFVIFVDGEMMLVSEIEPDRLYEMEFEMSDYEYAEFATFTFSAVYDENGEKKSYSGGAEVSCNIVKSNA